MKLELMVLESNLFILLFFLKKLNILINFESFLYFIKIFFDIFI